MSIDYQKKIDDAVFKKLRKLTINEIRIVVNQLQLKYQKPCSKNFYNAFVNNVRSQNDTRIRPLYLVPINHNFNQTETEKLKQMAEKYQNNQLNQTIQKKVNQTFDEQFKDKFQALLRLIAYETMMSIPFS